MTFNASNGAMDLTWSNESRLAVVHFGSESDLTGKDAAFIAESFGAWIGSEPLPFALLADVTGIRSADAEYREGTRDYFAPHRDRVYIAVTHMGPVVRVIAEMFRVATGVEVKAFANDEGARAWLREKGIAA